MTIVTCEGCLDSMEDWLAPEGLCGHCKLDIGRAIQGIAEAMEPRLTWADARGVRQVYLECTDWAEIRPDGPEDIVTRRQAARDMPASGMSAVEAVETILGWQLELSGQSG